MSGEGLHTMISTLEKEIAEPVNKKGECVMLAHQLPTFNPLSSPLPVSYTHLTLPTICSV